MEAAELKLAPVAGKARIDVLDMLRGLAILGIFFMNIPFMGASVAQLFVDPHRIGWSPLDAGSWYAVQIVLEGTQRGLLELLFGAGMMVLAARAMDPEGPVAIADLHIRRNLWLLGFGLVDIFLLGWAGDILHVYALAALFLFPFRKLGPKALVALGLAFAAFVLVTGGIRYQDRAAQIPKVEAAKAKQNAHAPMTAEEKKTLDDWAKLVERRTTGGEEMKEAAKAEEAGRKGGVLAYLKMNIGFYLGFVYPSLLVSVCEALCMMMIGIALWKWRVIQGGRDARFYLVMMLACYVPAIALRYVGAGEYLTMALVPKISWATGEIARILMSLGHVALINLAVKSAAGRLVLAPFKAAGRTAFSLYFMQQIIGLWILFAPWGPGLWAKLSWSGLYAVVLVVIAFQLLVANLWLTRFVSGPLEWAWRSLAYCKRQPFLRRSGPVAPADTGEAGAVA